jgi:pilus assembly protein CpaE
VLRSIIICPDPGLAQRLEAALLATGEVAVCRTLNRYPNAIDITRAIRAHTPDIVFLSFESLEKAVETVKLLDTEATGVQVLAIHQQCDANLLRETMRAGVREFLSEPFERRQLQESLAHVRVLLERKPPSIDSTNQIFSFLPSKAGVGTSTIALNVSAAIAHRPDTHVLLADFDFNSGMMRFMLKLTNEFSVIDALEHSLNVDENLWSQLVTSMEGLDVLHAGRLNPSLRVEGAQIRALVGFLRRNYQAVCFDLSGNLERYSIELMQESKRVLLVCTPEIASLHLAREKLSYLRSLDLDGRVSVILNRCHKRPLFTKEQVEELLGLPVWKMFPNDYVGVNRALTAASWVAPETELGKSFADFAQTLLEERTASRPEKRKFLEFFAVPHQTLASGEK